MILDGYQEMFEGKARNYQIFLKNWKESMRMLKYGVIILPLAEKDISNNTDYIF